MRKPTSSAADEASSTQRASICICECIPIDVRNYGGLMPRTIASPVGCPGLPGVVAFCHIHMRDLHLSPCNDPTRVFCLCWHHHQGCYDQGYITTGDLLRAEAVWIANKCRPKPHRRYVALAKKVAAGAVIRHCVWTERRAVRSATFDPWSGGPISNGLLE
jgi:hypothetical protein